MATGTCKKGLCLFLKVQGAFSLADAVQTKVTVYKSRDGYVYETEFEIWAGFGHTGSTENSSAISLMYRTRAIITRS